MTSTASLTRHLLAWTLGALGVVWASFLAVGYLTGQHEADELTDGHLASVAALLAAYGEGQFTPGREPLRPAGAAPELRAHDYQQSMSIAIWDASGRLLTRRGDAPAPAFSADEGFATMRLGQPVAEWRVFSRWNDDHTRKVMVLLSARERDDLAGDIAGQISEPGLWLLPVIALVLGIAVQRGLRPLYQLTRDVHALDVHAPQPLPATQRHKELRAIADAIQHLVERYHAALTRERTLADAFAHELRTPLASLSLHAAALKDLPDGPESREAAARVQRDAHRASEVLSHLLALARADRAELDEAAQPVDLCDVAREIVAEFAPAAHASGHELGLSAGAPLVVQGHRVLLFLALRNLVENALGHTPPGTQVEVSVDAAARTVQVCDDGGGGGSGVSGGEGEGEGEAEGALVAGSTLGLGLGHRVTDKVAAIHGARFDSGPAPGGVGRCYRIVFGPPARPQA